MMDFSEKLKDLAKEIGLKGALILFGIIVSTILMLNNGDFPFMTNQKSISLFYISLFCFFVGWFWILIENFELNDGWKEILTSLIISFSSTLGLYALVTSQVYPKQFANLIIFLLVVGIIVIILFVLFIVYPVFEEKL